MAENEIAIKAESVSKEFILPHEKANSLKGVFTSLPKRKNKTREVQHALRDIDFEIKKGEFFGIVGRNGSGKSTMLKILAGIYQPTKGHIKVEGKLVPFIELGVGFNGELTGRENVYLNGAMLGFSEKEIDALYDDIVGFAELEKFMDQKLKNYSSGMQVRLAFSMATRAQADVLLIDEVLAVGDADFQRKCFEHFRTLKRNKKTVVFVSHDMSAIREYCDRAVMIEKSRVVCSGTADEVATEYVKLFNQPKEQAEGKADNTGRWGDGGMKFTSVKTKLDDEKLILDMEAEAYSDVEEPIFGYLVRNSAGSDLLGTNTKLSKKKVGTLKKGDKVSVRWEVPNIFNDGIYVVTVALSHNNEVSQYDWWENATSFTAFREDKTPYVLNPTPVVDITVHK